MLSIVQLMLITESVRETERDSVSVAQLVLLHEALNDMDQSNL